MNTEEKVAIRVAAKELGLENRQISGMKALGFISDPGRGYCFIKEIKEHLNRQARIMRLRTKRFRGKRGFSESFAGRKVQHVAPFSYGDRP